MNEKVRNIIEVAKEFTEVNKKVEKFGIITGNRGEFHVYEKKLFKELMLEGAPSLQDLGEGNDFRYRYRLVIDGVMFLYIADDKIEEEENEST